MIKMSAPALEAGQDDDDILGFPGDGFVDKTDANPDVIVEQDEEGDDARNNEVSVKKRRKSAVVASDGHVIARIKELKQKNTGSKREDNEWTKGLRAKLDEKIGDRSSMWHLQVLQEEQGGSQAARARPVPLVACSPLRDQQMRSGDKEGAQRNAHSGRRACFPCLESILPR